MTATGHAPVSDAPPGYAKRWWVLATMTVCLLVVITGNTILNVAIPTVQRELHATQGELQWAVDAYILVFAGLLFSWGVVGDRIGRKRVLLIGLSIFAARLGARGVQFQPARADRLARRHGHRRRGRPADHPRGDHERLPGQRARQGHRRLGRHRRHRRRGRPAGRRRGAGELLVGLGLPRRRPGRDRGHRRRRAPSSPSPRTPRPAGSTSRACCCRSAPSPAWSTGSSGAAPARAGRRPASWSRCSAASRCSSSSSGSSGGPPIPRWTSACSATPPSRPRPAALGLNFFALLGATFYLVFYLQGVRGYTPLQSGAALIPVAVGMALMAPRSSGLAERFGAKAVVASGFVLIALSFVGIQLLGLDHPRVAADRRALRAGSRHGRGDGARPPSRSCPSCRARRPAPEPRSTTPSVRSAARSVWRSSGRCSPRRTRHTSGRRSTGCRPGSARTPASRSWPRWRRSGRSRRAGTRTPPAPPPHSSSPAKEAFVSAMHVTAVFTAGAALVAAGVVLVWLPGRRKRVSSVTA